ncbi:MAG: cohesin domain-containing protein [Anaerolineaceae bacterium]|nr:cohesin domain-containing protein [Anaerolineaceae bacterium]
MKQLRVFLALFIVTGFLLLPHTSVFGQSANTQIGFFGSLTSAPDTRIEVPVEIHNVEGLYALDLSIKFDPTILTVEDADASQAGVQVALGKFLDPGMVLFNTVDNQKGTIHFVMTQANPSEPKSGTGNLLVIYFKGLKEGKSDLGFANIQLSDRDGIQITAIEKDATITLSNGAPTQAATSIPVQEVALLTQIPTMMPTATATEVPTLEPTLAPTAVSEGASASAPENLPIGVTGASTTLSLFQMGQLFLMKNWWIVLVLLIIVVAMVAYLAVTRNKTKANK